MNQAPKQAPARGGPKRRQLVEFVFDGEQLDAVT
jgi:hypothetical protein